MKRQSVQDVPTTPHFNFLYGAFQLSKWTIPYLSTNLTVHDAANSLNLTSELPGAENIRWAIDELFQRDIDWPRVEQQVLPYLRNAEEPQFFNSITVALLPFDGTTGELRESFSNHGSWRPPPLTDGDARFEKQMTIGPVSLGFWEDWEETHEAGIGSGQLRWNPDEIFGVALDGQHRLAALKALAKNTGTGVQLQSTRVPIILLLFSEDLGFKAPASNTQIGLLRKLFIDLNKHARTVTRARQILLDDRDPQAICVRQLVSRELSDNLDDLVAAPPRLPLSLIDWHSEQAKFDVGPHLTTVLGLDWIVGRCLNISPIKDYTNYADVRRQIVRLRRSLDLTLDAAYDRVEHLQSTQLSPFTYSDAELREISAAFTSIWSAPLCHILTGISCYGDLISLRRETHSLSLDFQHWYELRIKADADKFEGEAKQEYRRLLGRFSSRQHDPIVEAALESIIEEIDAFKNDILAFNVVFQRAVIEAFLEYAKIGSEQVEELALVSDEDELDDIDFDDPTWSEDESNDDIPDDPFDSTDVAATVPHEHGLSGRISARAGEFVAALNLLLENWPEILNLYCSFEAQEDEESHRIQFWLGTLLRAEGGVDFTQGASRRAKDLLFAVAALWLYDDRTEPGSGSDFDEFWALCDDPDAPAVVKRIVRAIRRFSGEDGAAGRIIRSRDEDYTEQSGIDEAYWRLRAIWEVLEL